MEKLNLDKKSLRNFGVTMSVVFFIIWSIIFIKQGRSAFTPLHPESPTFQNGVEWRGVMGFVFAPISAFFLSMAFLLPKSLRPIYIFWMKLAFVLSWINTRIILFAIFYLIFTPIGLCMRLFGADLLGKKIEKTKLSYWNKKDNALFNLTDYQRQF